MYSFPPNTQGQLDMLGYSCVFLPIKYTGAVGYFECSSLTQSGLSETMMSAMRAGLSPSGTTSHKKRFTWFRKKRYLHFNAHSPNIHLPYVCVCLCGCVPGPQGMKVQRSRQTLASLHPPRCQRMNTPPGSTSAHRRLPVTGRSCSTARTSPT